MAKSRAEKEALLQKYQDTLSNSSGYIAVDLDGVDTTTVTELKMRLKEIGSNVIVVKNKIFQIALQDSDVPSEAVNFEDQTAIIPYSEDPTEPAKMIKEVQKETEKMPARYGVINGTFLSDAKVMELADIPSREELYAKMLGSLVSPLSGFQNAVTGNVRGFTQALHQMSEKEA